MRRSTIIFVLLALLAAPLFVPSTARASTTVDVYATQQNALYDSESVSRKAEAVRWWYAKADKTYYLFMPAATVSLYLWVDSTDAVLLDGEPFQSGQEATFLLDGISRDLSIGKKSYTLRVMRSAQVPALFITTVSGSLSTIHHRKGNQETGTLHMIDQDGQSLYNGALEHIKGRGNATFVLNKKPYQIKLEQSTDICGMGKAKTWVLLAEYRDNSLLRNRIAFDLANAVGLAYSSQSRTVDVYINNDYLGAYTLCEKVEIGETRVDIADLGKETQALNDAKLDSYARYGYNKYRKGTQKGYKIPNDPADITGGYLLEMDYKMRYSNEKSGFVTAKGQAVVIKEPDAVSQNQVTYIAALMQGFENAIHAKDGIDSKTGKHYSEFVDMDSLVRKYVLEEVLKNRDANRSSLYFYKPTDSVSNVAFAGPAWDYDAALGNYATRAGDKIIQPEFFGVNNDQGESFYIFPALYAKEDFLAAVKSVYETDFVPALEVLLGIREDETGMLQSLQAYADELADCAAMNFIRWPVFNTKARIVQTGATYQENIDYLYNFIQKRMDFLAGEWLPS